MRPPARPPQPGGAHACAATYAAALSRPLAAQNAPTKSSAAASLRHLRARPRAV